MALFFCQLTEFYNWVLDEKEKDEEELTKL